ncbi:MAG: pyridoxal phosphate-dependent aminotransferase family protein [Chloroflexota bacterium]|nr:pyridoxal phosphate-dependent aminotransferase family protein [Chloroflexota bacterium]
MDLFEKCHEFTAAKEAMEAGYYPYFIPLSGTEGTEASVNGHKLIMIGSLNYLGLATHPKVREAAINAVRKYGTGCTGSRFLNGNLAIHQELEERLADFMGRERALVFSTGYQTNLGTISALIGRGDIVINDRDDHASIVDGCRLGWGEMRRFRHNDMDSLERILERCDPEAGKMVIVDGVYSMNGDIAPLPEMIPICQRYGAKLMVDDAHSIGVLGQGRGTAAHLGITEGVDITMATFSKAFASLGGFIVGDEPVIHYIRHFARSLIFSASPPPASVATCLAALDIMETETWRYERLAEIAIKMREGYRSLGFETGPTETPIVPIIIRDEMKTLMLWKALFDAGLYTNAVIPPAVAPNESRLRTSYMATHTDEQLDRVLEILEEVGTEVGVI